MTKLIKKSALWILILVPTLFSCKKKAESSEQTSKEEMNNTQEIVISGKIENVPEEGVLLVEKMDYPSPEVIDTISVASDGDFKYTLKYQHPDFYRLNLYNKQSADLVVDGFDLKVAADLANDENEPKVTGSPSVELLSKAKEFLMSYQKEATGISEEYTNARNEENEKGMKEAEAKFENLQKEISVEIKKMIEGNPPNLTTLQLVGMLNPDEDYELIEKTSKQLKEKYPNVPAVTRFTEEIEKMNKLAVGQAAPDFSLMTPEGKELSLSSFKGNYVLVDFWASWCRPCRVNNPKLVKLYDKYQGKNFDILGVSFDNKKEDWEKAIKDDGLAWSQVSDLKGFESEVAEEYQIEAIPAVFLIDPDGNIVGKNMPEDELEALLSSKLK